MKASDLYKVIVKSNLSSDDFQVLLFLYQPLIGITATSIFMTLYNFNCNEFYRHQDFFDMLNIKQSEFIKAKEKLEALSLIETFVSKNEYLYLLKKPVSAKEFLNDIPIYGTYLESELGEKAFSRICSHFKVETVDYSEYKNISKSFDEVFEVRDVSSAINYDLKYQSEEIRHNIKNSIDYNAFCELIPRKANRANLLSPKLEELINQIAYVYQFKIEELVEIYSDSLDQYGNVIYSKLSLNARNYYSQNHLEKSPTIIDKVDPEISKIDLVNTLSPSKILEMYSKKSPMGLELSVINELISRNKTELGVINAVLLYVLKHKNGVLPTLNYLEKVLNTWSEKGVVTTKDALNYIMSLEENSSSKSNYSQKFRNKKVREEPDWFQEALKNIRKGD